MQVDEQPLTAAHSEELYKSLGPVFQGPPSTLLVIGSITTKLSICLTVDPATARVLALRCRSSHQARSFAIGASPEKVTSCLDYANSLVSDNCKKVGGGRLAIK